MSWSHRVALLALPLLLVRCQCDDLNVDTAPGAVRGRLCDIQSGQAAPGVTLTLEARGADGTNQEAKSGPDGTFELLTVPPGIYGVVITQELGEETDRRTVPDVEVRSDQQLEVQDPACLVVPPPPGTGAVHGRVCNRHVGNWVTGASVMIDVAGTAYQTVTDANGDFLLADVPEGERVLQVANASFQKAYPVHIFAGQTTELAGTPSCSPVDPSSGGIEGLLCTTSGTIPPGATVSVDIDGTIITEPIAADGRFVITGLPPGRTVTVQVAAGAYRPQFQATVAAGEIVQVGPTACTEPTPDPTGRVEGMFCHPDGGPLVGANLSLIPSGAGLSVPATTNDTGHFSIFAVTPGFHTLEVRHAALAATLAYEVTVVAEQTATVIPQANCDEEPPPPPPPEDGDIRGRICAPNGTTWLAGARVWVVTADNALIETTTDGEGYFLLENVPVGDHTVHVQAGSFTVDIAATVVADQVTEVGDSPDACVPIDDRKIAVVTGVYDHVQDVLARLGLADIDDYTGPSGVYRQDLLLDYELMQTYDVIFFNCGMNDNFLSDPALYTTAINNLRAYVQSGRSVYASDWAYDIVEVAWPGFVDFYGEDGTRNVAQAANNGESIPATVSDAGLAAALGTSNVVINFNLPRWAVIDSVSADTTVYLRANSIQICNDQLCNDLTPHTNAPLTVGFHPAAGAGKVIYTSFHQEQQTTQDMDTILELMVFEL